MKKLLLAGCLWPVLTMAQEVKPVYSDAYRSLIQKDSSAIPARDSSNSMRSASLKLNWYVHHYTTDIRKIITRRDSTLKFKPLVPRVLYIGGSWSSTAEWQRVNRLPEVQQEFVQGRPVNGQATWLGPETYEVFSYGPSIKQLEYNGQAYPYDINGRLVAVGTGNGQSANAYNNRIFRPGAYISNNLGLNLKYPSTYGNNVSLGIKTGQTREKTIIRDNKNQSRYTTVTLEAAQGRFNANGSYNYRADHYGHSNRDGFLNRVYQQSLLTPVSFSNAQGSRLNNGQRTYSQLSDNPLFLLEQPSAGFERQQHSTMTGLEYRVRKLKFKLGQSFDHTQQYSDESLSAGTAAYPAGRMLKRSQQDKNYSLQSSVNGNFQLGDYRKYMLVNLNYIYSDNRTDINYGTAHPSYQYQRSSHNISLSLSPYFRADNSESGLNLSYSCFTSNTSRRHYWLPMVSAYHRFLRLFANNDLNLKLFGSYNRFNSELPLSKSLAAVSLLQLDPEEAYQYSPVLEASSFAGLQPVEHRELQGGVEMQFSYKFSLNATWFNRTIRKDIFPFIQNNLLQLKNMAGHFNRGIELQFDYNPWLNGTGKVKTGTTLSFVRYQSKVTRIEQGYEQTPLAGFRNIHTALVKDKPLGVIVGTGWQRNATNQVVIGNDGFPLVDPQLKVVGSPIPDFTMKLTEKLRYKNWSFLLDLEWRKGGVSWNGTQAMLDYYGRSAVSAAERGTMNYVFDGVRVNGNHNTLPVSFNDPSLPLSQNRWVRYGPGGVAEDYIQNAGQLRISTVNLSWKPVIKKFKGQPSVSTYVNNVVLWSPYKGTDPSQLLFDQSGTQGLDFFNLPAVRSAGISLTIQF